MGFRPHRTQLLDPKSRFCALSVGERPVGFAHFRFELELDALRGLIMEFQIEPEFQWKGLGRFLLQAIEFIVHKRGMEHIFLTVFHINDQETLSTIMNCCTNYW
jgi:GNAT superfamily N-acetyltransferase